MIEAREETTPDNTAIKATVQGRAYTKIPDNLYIPPDALEVFLEIFSGPLDLLLYLIKRQNLDILDIPITQITEQYVHYIDMMKELNLDLAGEYLLMAAMLAEIKSRMLLPQYDEGNLDEEDPRAELIRRLQEYERYKDAAENIDKLERCERDIFIANAKFINPKPKHKLPEVSLDMLAAAFVDVLARSDFNSHHIVQVEVLSVRERMTIILDAVNPDQFIEFSTLFKAEEGRAGIVVTFIAILQLFKDALLELMQNEINGPIYIKAITATP